jgi:hypothetical protein
MIECPIDSSPPWDELLIRAQVFLGNLGNDIAHLNADAASLQQKIHEARCVLGIETNNPTRESTMLEMETSFEESKRKFGESKKSFEELFQLAKYVLGKPLDDGHGYGPFIRRIEANVKEHRQ